MERFQGHINPCFLDRKAGARSLEAQGFAEAQSFALKEEEEEEEEESLQDTVPFLQMLQSEEDPSPFISFKEPNFRRLLSLQNLHKPWELESYLLSHEDHQQFHSLVQSDTSRFYHNPISASAMEGTNQSHELPFSRADMIVPSSSSTPNPRRKRKNSDLLAPEMTREKRKRRKTKPTKNIEDIENQRINHIAVERNRRRQMNEHINSLRSLLPPSYIQRGDQASIVGGAINYAKVLEQIIQSLESQKRTQQSSSRVENRVNEQATSNHNHHHLSGISSNEMWKTTHKDHTIVPRIEVTLIQSHVNLKVECPKRQGQLLQGIISLEKLRLTVLHLNISSPSHLSVSYSFNLKMEDECKLESADDITKAAHQIFDVPDDLINT